MIYRFLSPLMEALLSEHYLRGIFGEVFWISPSLKSIPLRSFALGLEQVIESQGAVISNATALQLNNTFSLGRNSTRRIYFDLFREPKLEQYCPRLLRESLAESLRQAFPLSNHFQVKMAPHYAPAFFSQSQVLYYDSKQREEFIRSHFKLRDSIDDTYYFIPQFTVEGLI